MKSSLRKEDIMSVKFSNISKTVDGQELVISPNPDKILLNFWAAAPPKKLSSDYLYALKASALKKYRSHLENKSLLIYEDVPLPGEYYQIRGLNIIATKDPDTFQKMKLSAQGIFDWQAKLNNYSYRLMTLCHLSANTQSLLDAGYSFLNNPLIVTDTSLALTASAGVYAGIDDPTLRYCMENSHLPDSFLDEMIRETLPKADEEFPELLMFPKGSKPHITCNIIACRIIRSNQLIGYLKLFELNHPMTHIEKNALIILCDFISIALTDSIPRLPTTSQQIEDFITDLLDRRISSPEAIEARMALYHLNSHQQMVLAVVGYDVQKSSIDRLYFFKKQLQSMFGTPCITFYSQLIVMIVPQNSLKENQEGLSCFLEMNNLIAGLSLPFESYTDLFMHYNQALACLDIRAQFSLTSPMIDYDDWKLIHLFLHFQECCSLSDLIPENVRILQKNDQARGTNLTETLFSYIRHNHNISETANELHLHYNTMKYRLNQITELTDIDFNDPDCMFRIIIAEKVMDILDNRFDTLRPKPSVTPVSL